MDRFDEQVRTGVQETMRISTELSTIIGGVEGLGPRFEQAQQSMQAQVVGAGQINDREYGSEPIDLMVRCSEAALADSGAALLRDRIEAVRVVRNTLPKARIVIDFGMFQGSPADEARNAVAPEIDFALVDAVVVTHAHIDHCGRLAMSRSP